MLLMQKASAGEHTANAGRVRHVYALTYAIYALACAQRVKQVVCLKRCRLCMYLCQITCTCVCAHVHSLHNVMQQTHFAVTLKGMMPPFQLVLSIRAELDTMP